MVNRKTPLTFNHELTFGPRPRRWWRWLLVAFVVVLLGGVVAYALTLEATPSASAPEATSLPSQTSVLTPATVDQVSSSDKTVDSPAPQT